MQTFLPYADFRASARCLDTKRLNKQIVECQQLIRAVARKRLGIKAGWQYHPAARMWERYPLALQRYHNACVRVWWDRGYDSHRALVLPLPECGDPDWLGDDRLHVSHQANLVRKLPSHYAPLFPGVDPSMPYFWPT